MHGSAKVVLVTPDGDVLMSLDSAVNPTPTGVFFTRPPLFFETWDADVPAIPLPIAARTGTWLRFAKLRPVDFAQQQSKDAGTSLEALLQSVDPDVRGGYLQAIREIVLTRHRLLALVALLGACGSPRATMVDGGVDSGCTVPILKDVEEVGGCVRARECLCGRIPLG